MSETTKKKTPDFSDHRDDFIIERLIIKKGVPIGDSGEVSVVEEQIESRRYNRQEFINSFRDEVGVINMLKKVNAGLLSPGVLSANFDPDDQNVLDITDVPTDVGDALNMVDQAHKLYASLPKELTQGMSFNEFCLKFDQNALKSYLDSVKSKEEGGSDK